MAKLRVHNFAISLDGYGAGPNQNIDAGLGEGGGHLGHRVVGHRVVGHRVVGRWGVAGDLGPAGPRVSPRSVQHEVRSAGRAGVGLSVEATVGGIVILVLACRTHGE